MFTGFAGFSVVSAGAPRRRLVVVCATLALLTGTAAFGCAGGRRSPSVQERERAVTVPPPGSVHAAEALAPQEPELPEGIFHVVRQGQTLWRIARAYGIAVDELARANGITDPSRIEIGQAIFVPGATSALDVPPYPAPPPEAPGAVPAAPWIPVAPDGFAWPLTGGEILSPFGARRSQRRHAGLDIRGARGEAVLASRAGRVIYSGSTMQGYGKMVILDHGDGLTSLYAHNSRLLVGLGEDVEQGQPIALVGRTGNATTDHLHFEIRRDNVPLDPLLYLQGIAEAKP
jgi:lipoprotein NlpD